MAVEATPSSGAPLYDPKGRRPSKPRPLTGVEQAFCIGLPILLFAAHLTFGAARIETSLIFAGLFGLATALLMTLPWARAGLATVRGLGLVSLAALLTAAAVTWPLTPNVPGGPHPIWSYVDAAPAAVIDRSAVILELIKLGGLCCVFIAAAALGAGGRRSRRLFIALLALSGAYAAWACAAHLVDPYFILGVPKRYATDRLTGSFFSANTAGTLFGVMLSLSTAMLLEQLGRGPQTLEIAIRRAAWPAAVGILAGTALLLTASRGAIAATAVALVLVLFLDAIRAKRRVRTSAALICTAICIGLVPLLLRAGQTAGERYAAASDDLEIRLTIFESHWNAFLAAPWTGYGLGSFETVNQQIMTAGNFEALSTVFALHNVYLQWLLEGGSVGAAAMFLTILLILIPIAVAACRGGHGAIPVAVTAASVVVLLHGLTDYALQIPSIQAFWACLLGLGYGQVRARR